MDLSYKKARITGFGGTLDNTHSDKQDKSCELKEAILRVRCVVKTMPLFNENI